MGRNKVGALLGVLIVAVAAAALFVPWGGKQAPDVTFHTLAGEERTLGELTGNGPVLMTFWATTCSTCITEMPYWQAFHDELSDHGLTIVGVAMEYDPVDDVRRMVDARALNYVIAPDHDGSIAQAFGDVRYTPTTVLIDDSRQVVWQREGRVNMERLANDLAELTGQHVDEDRLAAAD